MSGTDETFTGDAIPWHSTSTCRRVECAGCVRDSWAFQCVGLTFAGELAWTSLSEAASFRRITCSVGYAIGPACDPFDELMKLADQALYSAKSDGRNRVASRLSR